MKKAFILILFLLSAGAAYGQWPVQGGYLMYPGRHRPGLGLPQKPAQAPGGHGLAQGLQTGL